MAYVARQVNYFYTTIMDRPGEAFGLLSTLGQREVNLLAFNSVPMGPTRSQLTLFPDDADQFVRLADDIGLVLDGPHPAVIVQGDDKLGALAEVHEKLAANRINVFSSQAVADGKGDYGYVLYVSPGDVPHAVSTLND